MFFHQVLKENVWHCQCVFLANFSNRRFRNRIRIRFVKNIKH